MKGLILSKSVLISIFKRNGGEGNHTKIIENEMADFDRERLRFVENEEALIVCELESGSTFFTNIGIVFVSNGDIYNLPYSYISHVQVDKENVHSINENGLVSMLSIMLTDGNEKRLYLESGEPYFGLWNMIRFIANKNRDDKKYNVKRPNI